MQTVPFRAGLLLLLGALGASGEAEASSCSKWLASLRRAFAPSTRPAPTNRARLGFDLLGDRIVPTLVRADVFVTDPYGVGIFGALVSVTPTGYGNPYDANLNFAGSTASTDTSGFARVTFDNFYDPQLDINGDPVVEDAYRISVSAIDFGDQSQVVLTDGTSGVASFNASFRLYSDVSVGPSLPPPVVGPSLPFPTAPAGPAAPFVGSLAGGQPLLVAATDANRQYGLVEIVDARNGTPVFFGQPYAGYTGPITVALGDINGDGVPDLITGTGPGTSPILSAFDGANGSLLGTLNLAPGFLGGINVAAGDLDGDGIAEIVVGAGAGSDGVLVINVRTGSQQVLSAFYGIPTGVSVAVGDVDGDGHDDLIVGTETLSSYVRAFDGRDLNRSLAGFYAFGAYTGGINLGSGDLDGDGRSEILIGSNQYAYVAVSDVFGNFSRSFFAYPGFVGAARVTATRGLGHDNLLVGAGGLGGGSYVSEYDGLSDTAIRRAAVFGDPGYIGGVYVGGLTAHYR